MKEKQAITQILSIFGSKVCSDLKPSFSSTHHTVGYHCAKYENQFGQKMKDERLIWSIQQVLSTYIYMTLTFDSQVIWVISKSEYDQEIPQSHTEDQPLRDMSTCHQKL